MQQQHSVQLCNLLQFYLQTPCSGNAPCSDKQQTNWAFLGPPREGLSSSPIRTEARPHNSIFNENLPTNAEKCFMAPAQPAFHSNETLKASNDSAIHCTPRKREINVRFMAFLIKNAGKDQMDVNLSLCRLV